MMNTGMDDRIQFLLILTSEIFFRIRTIFKETVMNKMMERKFWNGIISKNSTFIGKKWEDIVFARFSLRMVSQKGKEKFLFGEMW